MENEPLHIGIDIGGTFTDFVVFSPASGQLETFKLLSTPNNSGCLIPIEVIAPPGTVGNALPPSPVAGGNVETSQRIVDVLLGALAQACPDKVPAASQGTMNNVTIGAPLWSPHFRNENGGTRSRGAFAYYETIGGGMGARPASDGPSALHSHMTNTLNTPVEALEYTYPLRVLRYEIRRGSGGAGQYRGGDGIRRYIQVLTDCQVTLLSERRRFPPYGLAGGQAGKTGENVIIRDGKEIPLPGKGSVDLQAGDVLSIRTPGGGGFGKRKKNEPSRTRLQRRRRGLRSPRRGNPRSGFCRGVDGICVVLVEETRDQGFAEASTGFEPVIRVLQTLAFPLGHDAVLADSRWFIADS